MTIYAVFNRWRIPISDSNCIALQCVEDFNSQFDEDDWVFVIYDWEDFKLIDINDGFHFEDDDEWGFELNPGWQLSLGFRGPRTGLCNVHKITQPAQAGIWERARVPERPRDEKALLRSDEADDLELNNPKTLEMLSRFKPRLRQCPGVSGVTITAGL